MRRVKRVMIKATVVILLFIAPVVLNITPENGPWFQLAVGAVLVLLFVT